jgi:hypothetical protein
MVVDVLAWLGENYSSISDAVPAEFERYVA